MGLFSQWLLTDEIEINTPTERIREFFVNLEENYIEWHPEDHRKFEWSLPHLKRNLVQNKRLFVCRRVLFKSLKEMELSMEASKKHIREKGEILKKLMEKTEV